MTKQHTDRLETCKLLREAGAGLSKVLCLVSTGRGMTPTEMAGAFEAIAQVRDIAIPNAFQYVKNDYDEAIKELNKIELR